MPNILFVCTGNTCRSPMAAAMAAKIFKDGSDGCVCVSRGISVSVPSRASEYAVLAAKNVSGANLKSHVARQIKQADVDKADLVVAMTESQKMYIAQTFSGADKKSMTLREAAGRNGGDVDDPFGKDEYAYRLCAEEIRDCLAGLEKNRPWETIK